MQRFRERNLTGGFNTQDHALTFFSSGRSAEFKDIENFRPQVNGGLSKATGFARIHQAPGVIRGLYRFQHSNGGNYFLLAAAGKIYQLTGSIATDTGITVNANAWVQFETALDRCVIADGVNAAQVWDGSQLSVLGNGAPSTAQQTLFYQNRLWVFSNTAPDTSLLFYSNPGDITTGYTSQFVPCDVNDGQKITGIAPFFIPGQLAPVLLVGKERSVGLVVGDGTLENPYTFIKISQQPGVSGFRHFVPHGQDVAYLTANGVTSIVTDQVQGNLSFRYLSEKIRSVFLSLPADRLAQGLAFYDWRRNRICFAVTETAASYANLLLHYDLQLNCWYKERWRGSHDCTAVLIDTDGTWYHGDSQGRVMVHRDDLNTFDGDAIGAYFKTPHLDFGDPGSPKQLKEVRVLLRGGGNFNMGVQVEYDFNPRSGLTASIPVNGNPNRWGAPSTLWSSALKWGENPMQTRRFYPGGRFDQAQFTFNQTGANQPIDIYELGFDVQRLTY